MRRSLFYMLFLVLTADGLVVFLLPVSVYMLTGSIEYTGLSYLLWWLPRLILIPIIGTYIDKLGVRPLSIISDIVRASACLFISLCEFSSDIILAIAFGVTGSIISIGNSQIIISYEKIILIFNHEREKLGNLISRMDYSGMILGPFLGMLFLFLGYRYLILIPCLLYLTNAIFFAFDKINLKLNDKKDTIKSCLKQENHNPDLHAKSFFKILATPIITLSIILAIGNNMFDGIIESTGMALIELEMGLPVKYFAIIDIAAGLCGVTGTYFYSISSTRFNRHSILLASVLVITFCSAMMIIIPTSFLVFVSCYALSISAKVFTGNLCRLIRLETIPAKFFGTASSFIVLLNQSILPVVGLMLWLSDGSAHSTWHYLSIAVSISLMAGLGLFWLLRPRAAI